VKPPSARAIAFKFQALFLSFSPLLSSSLLFLFVLFLFRFCLSLVYYYLQLIFFCRCGRSFVGLCFLSRCGRVNKYSISFTGHFCCCCFFCGHVAGSTRRSAFPPAPRCKCNEENFSIEVSVWFGGFFEKHSTRSMRCRATRNWLASKQARILKLPNGVRVNHQPTNSNLFISRITPEMIDILKVVCSDLMIKRRFKNLN